MREQYKKLTYLTKNEDLVDGFKRARKSEPFKHYGKDLDDIFGNALKKRDILESEEEKLKSVLKDHLPDLVTRKIAYYCNENLFF